jgi:methyl-accepting chemotaxis protein/methyl-accepting chemotaxis protein-1 (serine sensor receptor)
MTIGKTISLLCTALLALTILLGIVATVNNSHINADLRSIVDGPLPGLYSIGLLQGYTKEEKFTMLSQITAEAPAQKSQYEATLADLERKFQAEMKTYAKTIHTAKARELFGQLGPIQERWNQSLARITPLSRGLQTKEALELWHNEALVVSAERAKLFNEMLEERRSDGDAAGATAIAAGEAASSWSLAILAFAVVSGGLLTFFIRRRINTALTHAVGELSEGAEQVSSAASLVSGSSHSLAQDASEQAASLEQTSASAEELSSMTRRNSENSQQSAALMEAVSRRVGEANRTLADMTTSMREIGASSGKISKIIKVIDEIAFQTNILALNAAVEAARAGEAGLGFAVVADEVRNLAQRSAQAAKDTAELIEESILKSTEGSRRLGEVAASIQGITEGAGSVKILVDEVEASSKEQAQGIVQISKAVAHMDEATQRTAANAEESASASEQLSGQSQALMVVVEQLRALVGSGSANSALSSRSGDGPHSENGRPRPGNAPFETTRLAATRQQTRGPSPSRPALVAVGVSTRRPAEFPRDDNEFKEF